MQSFGCDIAELDCQPVHSRAINELRRAQYRGGYRLDPNRCGDVVRREGAPQVSAVYVELLQGHVARFWPDHRCAPLMWTLGNWPREHPEFRVLELAPSGSDQPWIYVSAGTAHLRSFDGVGHEYVIRTWEQERLMVELLAAVASYSTREDHDGSLHDGHTVPIGHPWVEGAEADHLYVNKPYFVSRDFATLRIDDSFSVQFLWLFPITEREKDWRHEHGQEAFEQWLEDHGVKPEDPARRSSV